MQAAATEPQLERRLQFVDAQRVGRQCGVPYTYGPNGISTYIWTWPMALVSPLKIEKVFGVDQRDTWVTSHFLFRACSNTSFHRVFGAGHMLHLQNSKHTHRIWNCIWACLCDCVSDVSNLRLRIVAAMPWCFEDGKWCWLWYEYDFPFVYTFDGGLWWRWSNSSRIYCLLHRRWETPTVGGAVGRWICLPDGPSGFQIHPGLRLVYCFHCQYHTWAAGGPPYPY